MMYWQHIIDKLKDNQKVYVLTVIANSGSSPGRKGFKMLVAQDGFIYGSIGGGVMEFSLVEEAQRLIIGGECPTYIKKQIHKGNIVDGSGMICSGEQTVAFHCLGLDHLTVVQRILDCLENGNSGTLRLTPESFDFSETQTNDQFICSIKSNEDWFFEEHLGRRLTLYIVGGGHVGVAVSQLLSILGFHVIVFDNRNNLNTLVENSYANQKLVVDYNEIENYVDQGVHSYIAIMTNKYTDDKLVLSRLINHNFGYIGVLGSKAKLKTMWKDLIKEGFTKTKLDDVHAPIGLSIKSETPEEIAVSIAAEIIKFKNIGSK